MNCSRCGHQAYVHRGHNGCVMPLCSCRYTAIDQLEQPPLVCTTCGHYHQSPCMQQLIIGATVYPNGETVTCDCPEFHTTVQLDQEVLCVLCRCPVLSHGLYGCGSTTCSCETAPITGVWVRWRAKDSVWVASWDKWWRAGDQDNWPPFLSYSSWGWGKDADHSLAMNPRHVGAVRLDEGGGGGELRLQLLVGLDWEAMLSPPFERPDCNFIFPGPIGVMQVEDPTLVLTRQTENLLSVVVAGTYYNRGRSPAPLPTGVVPTLDLSSLDYLS